MALGRLSLVSIFSVTVVSLAAALGEGTGSEAAAQTRAPDINFDPTPQVVVAEMLALAGVGTDDVVYDLGSGDGRIVILAAQKYGARGVGIELDPPLVELSRQIAREGLVDDKVTSSKRISSPQTFRPPPSSRWPSRRRSTRGSSRS
jgi:SAM-dependent methyltransferase